MFVHIQRIRAHLVHVVGFEDDVEFVAAVPEVAERGQQVLQPRRVGLRQQHAGVEGSRPVSVLRPVHAGDSGVVEQPVRQRVGPDGVYVLVNPSVLVENVHSVWYRGVSE